MRWVAILALGLWWWGCTIEESPELQTGSIEVHLVDSAGTEISGASIYIDDDDKGRRTPAVVSGIATGLRELWVWKPGYLPSDTLVEVFQFDTVHVTLLTTPAAVGAVELLQAPDSVVLLLNGEPSGQTPPAVFPAIGVGDYRISAYLPDFATDLPSLWRVQVDSAVTLTIPIHFTSWIAGNQPGDLVIPFTLPSDWECNFAIQDWRGHVVLLNFWYIQCQPCVLEFPYLQQVYAESGVDGGFQLLAVNPRDDIESIHEFRAQANLTFPLLCDGDGAVHQTYGIFRHPTNLLVDKRGVVRHRLGQVTYDMLRALVDQLLDEE